MREGQREGDEVEDDHGQKKGDRRIASAKRTHGGIREQPRQEREHGEHLQGKPLQIRPLSRREEDCQAKGIRSRALQEESEGQGLPWGDRPALRGDLKGLLQVDGEDGILSGHLDIAHQRAHRADLQEAIPHRGRGQQATQKMQKQGKEGNHLFEGLRDHKLDSHYRAQDGGGV